MSAENRFHYHTLDELRSEIERLGLTESIPLSEDFSVLSRPCEIAGHTLSRRFTVHPMEGFDADSAGTPGPLSFRRYTRYARGGASLIWFEATAVLREARSNPCQLWIHDENWEAFARLVEAAKRAGMDTNGFEPVCVLQLTHSGRYSRPDGFPAPIIAHHSPILDPLHKLSSDYPLVTDDYLDRLRDTYAHAAVLAERAGFDGVDIKGCHRYLMAELLASYTREGRYGGSLENRSRLMRETMSLVKSQCHRVFITSRINACDEIPYPYGFAMAKDGSMKPDLDETNQYIASMRAIGIPLINLTIANPYYEPYYGRPFDFPIANAPSSPEHPLIGVGRMFDIIGQLQKANPGFPVIGTGFSWLRQFIPYAASGVISRGMATLVGLGRSSFAYPDAPNDILIKGAMDPKKVCITCSGCTQIMRDAAHTGCVVRDKQLYGPSYRLGRRYAMDRTADEAARCRACAEPGCVPKCPAGIDIPGFLKAYADGDLAGAYAILRSRNALPELCSLVCPADELCRGGCIENIFSGQGIDIPAVQRAVSRMARLKGFVGVKLGASNGMKAAVVGGGPGGVAAAIRLLEKGYDVKIYESSERLGGVPDSTIPAGRYTSAREEIDAILKPALDAGRLTVSFRTSLGPCLTLAALRAGYERVVLAIGLGAGQTLGQAKGAVDAVTFLKEVKAGIVKTVPSRVAVLGAGNTAMDAGSAALSLGARDVFIVYRRNFHEMPAWREERDAFLANGGEFIILTQPLGYVLDNNGNLTGLRCARTELGEPDAGGRRRPLVVHGSEYVLPVDMCIEAIGQAISPEMRDALDGINFTARGVIDVNPKSMETSIPGVFAIGDAVNGGATAVQAVADANLL